MRGRIDGVDAPWLRFVDAAGNVLPDAAERAEREAERAERAEAELARLREELARRGG